jgi:hypothetical protein
MGKSSLLVSLCRRVVPGAGLVLFDPLGETAEAVRRAVAFAAPERLTFIDSECPPGLNALEGIGPESARGIAQRERRLNDLVHSLRRVRSGRYVDSGFWGPRLEEMLVRALSAAAAFPGGTLEDAHALLATGGRGFRVVPPEAREAVGELGDRIRSRPEDADGARRLLFEVVRNPLLVRAFCRRAPELRTSELLGPGRIVLISGDAARVGETTSRYLLSIYLAIVWSDLLSRPNAPKTYVVMDEAQWFAHESLTEMLRVGRRRNVHVIVTTQAIASLPEAVAESIWTNVSDFVGFRGSPEEARELARLARGLSAESVLALPRGEAAVLLGKGNAVHWVRTPRLPGASFPALPPVGSVTGPKGRTSDPLSPELREISRLVRITGSREPVRISLADVRRSTDVSDGGVRTAGALLGREGALLRSGRDARGTWWCLDPRRVERLMGSGEVEETAGDSTAPQPS